MMLGGGVNIERISRTVLCLEFLVQLFRLILDVPLEEFFIFVYEISVHAGCVNTCMWQVVDGGWRNIIPTFRWHQRQYCNMYGHVFLRRTLADEDWNSRLRQFQSAMPMVPCPAEAFRDMTWPVNGFDDATFIVGKVVTLSWDLPVQFKGPQFAEGTYFFWSFHVFLNLLCFLKFSLVSVESLKIA